VQRQIQRRQGRRHAQRRDLDSKYSNEKPGRARRKTCLDQYKANKATSANGGLKWLQRGGGYYSQCVKKLKGAA